MLMTDLMPAIAGLGECMPRLLDQIDYGILLLDADGRVMHANAAARAAMDARHPLDLRADELVARRPEDAGPLRRALEAAGRRGLRTLLSLGAADQGVCAAVIPLSEPAPGAAGVTLVVIGRAPATEGLSAQWYARDRGLTSAEFRVLSLLCTGTAPSEIARRQGVAMSTVRSQIGSLRAKTGSRNIGELVRRVMTLPPLASRLSQPAAVHG